MHACECFPRAARRTPHTYMYVYMHRGACSGKMGKWQMKKMVCVHWVVCIYVVVRVSCVLPLWWTAWQINKNKIAHACVCACAALVASSTWNAYGRYFTVPYALFWKYSNWIAEYCVVCAREKYQIEIQLHVELLRSYILRAREFPSSNPQVVCRMKITIAPNCRTSCWRTAS